jgi:hypothetical protein
VANGPKKPSRTATGNTWTLSGHSLVPIGKEFLLPVPPTTRFHIQTIVGDENGHANALLLTPAFHGTSIASSRPPMEVNRSFLSAGNPKRLRVRDLI